MFCDFWDQVMPATITLIFFPWEWENKMIALRIEYPNSTLEFCSVLMLIITAVQLDENYLGRAS